MMSLPVLPKIESLPQPPVIVLVKVPPKMMSSPEPPTIESLP